MASQQVTKSRNHCPSCGEKGRPVELVTLSALLKEPYRDMVSSTAGPACHSVADGCTIPAGGAGWRFCASPNCNVVYFSEADGIAFRKEQVRVPVGIKEKTGDRPLCYCFGHSIATIKDELRTKGRSDALQDIRRKMKDLGCRCQVTNPSGRCCLGSVAKGLELAQEELGDAELHSHAFGYTLSGEKLVKIGALVSAVVASSCCWLPLVFLALGSSGAGIAATMHAYRPTFIVVTIGLLAAAFYVTYRPRRRTGDTGHTCCPTESMDGNDAAAGCCTRSVRRRFRMIPVNKIMLWVVTVVAVLFVLFPQYMRFPLGSSGTDGATVTAEMNQVVMKIEGMTCAGCAATVARAIRTVPGVLAVEVSYQTGQAVVGTDRCWPVSREQVLHALKRVGYKGQFVETETSVRPPR